MMKIQFTSMLCCLATIICLAACSRQPQTPATAQESRSNRYSYEYVKQISLTQPKLALRILQTAEDKELMPVIEINVLRSMVYFNSARNAHKAITYLEAALNDPDFNKRSDLRDKLLSMASLEYYSIGQYAKSLLYAEKGIDEAYRTNNRRLVAQIMTTMGQCHAAIGNMEQAVDCYDRTIIILNKEKRKSHTWDIYYDLVTTYALKANTLLDMNRLPDLFRMQPNYEAAVQKTNSLPEGINGANDAVNATYYSLYAIGYERAGKHALARSLFDKLATTRTANTPDGATFVTPYFILTKRYPEALQYVEREEQAWRQSGKDTINHHYAHDILTNKVRALMGLGLYKKACETGIHAYELDDSLTRRIREQNALWISQKLGKKLLRKYIGQQDKNLAISQAANIVMAVLLFICVALLAWIIRYNQKIKQKNLAASSLISELLLYKKQLLEQVANKDSKEEAAKDSPHGQKPQYEDFLKMEKLIIDKELFTQARLERADVAKAMGKPADYVNELFARYSDTSFSNYINDLRMERAAKLLKTTPNYTIEAIAMECGVPVRQTFHRLFAKKFGMTPAEYRNSQ